MEGLTRFAAPHRFATVGTFHPDAWERILEAVDKPELWPGAVDDAVGQLPAWSLARFHNDVLPADADPVVLSVSGLAVEYMDDARVDADWLRERWGHLRFAAYTTAFHQRRLAEREPGPRWRLLLPFAAPVPLDVAVEVARWVRHPAQGRGEMSPVTDRPDRLLPLPAMATGGYASCVSDGQVLDVELALRELKGWRDQDRV
ncbi:MAG: hypothetical protein GY913_12985 [Proteobacteria bacterium]|nr:hypothetical protein [Pseudomonadota bacterium]